MTAVIRDADDRRNASIITQSSIRLPIDVRARRLHDEHIRAADVLVDLERALCIRKPLQAGLPDVHAEKLRNLARQGAMRASRKTASAAHDS